MSENVQGHASPSFVERMKHLTVKFAKGSEEPHQLYLKRNGCFVRSFADLHDLEAFVLKMSESTLTPNKISRTKKH